MRKYKYKVVKKRNNKSCVMNGNSLFCLTYEKDTNVYAIEGTLGVMVFKTRTDAELWVEGWDNEDYWKIKRVLPIGRGKVPKKICSFSSSAVLKDFYNNYNYANDEPVPGTICYPGVYVVD